CIFCKVINGELPSAKVFENEDVVAFLDISQITKGHTLVIPKVHNENIVDLQPDIAAKLFEVGPTIANALEAAYNPTGMHVMTTGHTIVLPKGHNDNIFDQPPDIEAKLFEVVPTIANALKAAYNPKGINLLNNNGSFAGQEVFHYHMHIIPRYDENDGFGAKYISHQSEYSGEDLQAIAKSIRDELN